MPLTPEQHKMLDLLYNVSPDMFRPLLDQVKALVPPANVAPAPPPAAPSVAPPPGPAPFKPSPMPSGPWQKSVPANTPVGMARAPSGPVATQPPPFPNIPNGMSSPEGQAAGGAPTVRSPYPELRPPRPPYAYGDDFQNAKSNLMETLAKKPPEGTLADRAYSSMSKGQVGVPSTRKIPGDQDYIAEAQARGLMGATPETLTPQAMDDRRRQIAAYRKKYRLV